MTALDRLAAPHWATNFVLFGSARAQRAMLLDDPTVLALRQELLDGVLTEATLRRFVANSVRTIVRGMQCERDVALAGIAVAIESLRTPYAEAYLKHLAELRVRELPTSTLVAGECLHARRRQGSLEVTVLTFRLPTLTAPFAKPHRVKAEQRDQRVVLC